MYCKKNKSNKYPMVLSNYYIIHSKIMKMIISLDFAYGKGEDFL